MSKQELKMTFDPNTIEHLGVRMYSTLPPVLAELIGNAYDADAEHVVLTLNDKGEEKEITVEDDGMGMSYDDINDKFLRIGRNRRLEDESETTPKGRKVIGKKGLGKLSFFGIAHEIEISTKKEGKENVFKMTWEDIVKEKKEYKPKIVTENGKCSDSDCGTKIVLRKIQRESDFSPEDIANNLSKLFIIDSGFEVAIRHNLEEPFNISNERRCTGLEKDIEWNIPTDYRYSDGYEKANQVSGHLMAVKKPIPPNTNMRGIILFSRKKMVNLPEYFSDSASSHFFSYLTGWLEVDFIDDLEEDVIATTRKSLNWDHNEMKKLRDHLRKLINWLERDWRKKRKEKRERNISEATGINISDWFGKLPDDIRKKIEPVIDIIVRDSELSEETHGKTINMLHEIVPEYPYYRWRHLHSEIKAASETDYRKNDFYRSFQEAVKRYINAVKTKSGSKSHSEAKMMDEVFDNNNNKTPILLVAHNFKKPNGNDFNATTINNIQKGHNLLSKGVVTGCRNPVSHEEIADLRDSGLFTEKDCLDALSLLSHLFTRLDNSQKKI